jgi:DNA-binding winged helix-turn-helix (wHTH) protein
MSSDIFIINNRFRVYPALNQVQDMQTRQIIRLEPRIMAVLQHLSRYAGQLVSREELIRDIWHNYGGGDEGLSQAISFLRKTLGDQEKTLIRTIPKKGYCLTAVLRVDEVQQPTKRLIAGMRSFLKYAVMLYVLGTAVYFISGGLHLQPTTVQQNVSLITRMEPRQLSSAVSSEAKKNLAIAVNSKSMPKVRPKILDTFSNNTPNTHLANTETNSYHLSDQNAQMLIALDYQVTTSVNVSTTLN